MLNLFRRKKLEKQRKMINMAWSRIAGHVFFMPLYLYHGIGLSCRVDDLVLKNPELEVLKDIFIRYFTVWNLILQIVYAFVSLILDLTTVYNKEYLIPPWLRSYRYTVFAGLLWPMCWVVFLFWPVYFYRFELITVPEVDDATGPACNFVIHGAVQIYALWELLHLPQDYLRNARGSCKHFVAFVFIYTVSIFYTRFVDKGFWLYPILQHFDGTITCYLVLSVSVMQGYTAYCAQSFVKNFLSLKLGLVKKIK